MGWGHCGHDSNGRPIGYSIEAYCDHPGCKKSIDRGLAYVCGGMHGSDELSCEKYFCSEHLYYSEHPDAPQLCEECCKLADEAYYEEFPDQRPVDE